MKSEYFVLLLNDIFTKFRSHRCKNEKVMTENLSLLNAPILMTPQSHLKCLFEQDFR